jgi:NAD(P)-dependent dehydrogenase (short-subunit alcohol dehydrogenase family)
MAKLDGKIALISGGTTGIGAETAKLFQSEGATVIVTGSSERSVEAAKGALPGIEVLVSDAGDVAATKVLVDQVKTKHGRIDVLVVNAGIAKFAPIEQVDEAFYDSQFNINVKGAFFLLKHAIPIGRSRLGLGTQVAVEDFVRPLVSFIHGLHVERMVSDKRTCAQRALKR